MKNSKEQENFIRKMKKRHTMIKTCQFLFLFIFLALWEICSDTGLINKFIFASPSSILLSAIDLASDGTLFRHIFVTVFETVIGFTSGTVLGTLIAVILWWNGFISDVSEPYLVVLNSLPKTALAPIIIVWLGNNMKAIIAVALMTSIVVTVLNVLNGFNSADKDEIKLIRSFGGTKKQVLSKVVIPSSMPSFVNALKINVGLSFVGVIVGEFLTSKEGLGYMIVYNSQIFKMQNVMLSVVILCILAGLLYKAIQILENQILKRFGRQVTKFRSDS
ncbi:MAG: ABC transporter permease [Clostridia bacterium]|jgi:NitT/TauT family transport system permease protein|nr:ABC transporter permease [Clostridia bacterium]MCI2000179.1 ABC transporter permease [Clostridia bacterium]MCI2014656.1 ABC transporter permease [Clostridia bacterium]